jgi:hypothetical protein
LSLTYLRTQNCRGAKSGIHGSQTVIPPCPVPTTICCLTWGMPHCKPVTIIYVVKTSTYTEFCDIYHNTVSFVLSVLLHIVLYNKLRILHVEGCLECCMLFCVMCVIVLYCIVLSCIVAHCHQV